MKLEKALKQLQNRPELGIPNPEFVLRTKEMLLAKMQAEQPPKLSFGTKLSFVQSFIQAFFPPQFAYVTAVFALMISAVAAGAMARKALPGTSFYSAKIALEYTQARLVSNPSERAKVQMDMAGRRLEELRAINEQTDEPNGRVEQTLKQFTKEVKSARQTLKQAGDPLQVEAATQELAKKARQYEEELLRAKAGVKPGREVGVAALEEALQELSTSQ